MNLFNISVRNVVSHRGRFALTALAVVLSIAFLTATLIITDSITGTAESDIADANADLSFVIEGKMIAEGGGAPGEAADRIAEAVPIDVATLAANIDGVASAVGETTGFAKLVAGGKAVGVGTATDEGRGWLGDSPVNPFRVVEGTAPGRGQVALARKLANDGNVAVSDTVQVLTPTGLITAEVSGLVTYGPADGTPLARTVLFAAEEAPTVLAQDGYQRIRIALDADADPATVRRDLTTMVAAHDEGATALSGGLVLFERSEFVADRQQAVTSPFDFLSIFLTAFAAIATVAGISIIFNTLVIAIGQRRRELALLRAVGAKRAQVLRSVLAEAALIAVVATAAGIGLGVLSAGWLRKLMDIAGLSFLDGPLLISGTTIAVAIVVGIGVTIGSAWSPARAAAAALPVEALREAAAEPKGVSRRRTIIGAVLLAAAVAMMVLAAVTKTTVLLAGFVLLVPGLVLAGPAFISGIAQRVSPLMGRVGGVGGSMASMNVARNPRRASSTSLGLVLGVAMVGFFAILASSISASFSTTLGETLDADLVVTSATPDFPTVDPGLVDRLNAIDGAAASALVLADGAVNGEGAGIGGIDQTFLELFDFRVSSGSLDRLADGGIAVWSSESDAVIGDTLNVSLKNGTVDLPVVAVFGESLAGFEAPGFLVSSALLESLEGGQPDFLVFVGAPNPGSAEAVENAVAATPGALFETRSSYMAKAGAEADAVANLIYALLGLTVVIAVLGVANTTALAISERTREIGMLRAVGTTQRGVRRIVRWEAALLAAIGGSVGAIVAVVSAWAFVRATGGATFNSLAIPWLGIVVLAVGAIAACILTAALPAWRAARAPTLDAIATT